jgi:hypothetical protein
MSDLEKVTPKNNIILNNHREALDYRTNPRYAEAVETTTEYVAGVIDLLAHALYITVQLSVRAAKGWRVAYDRTVEFSNQASEYYYEYGLPEKVEEVTASLKNKVNRLRESDLMLLDRGEVRVEAEVLPADGQRPVASNRKRKAEKQEDEMATTSAPQ